MSLLPLKMIPPLEAVTVLPVKVTVLIIPGLTLAVAEPNRATSVDQTF